MTTVSHPPYIAPRPKSSFLEGFNEVGYIQWYSSPSTDDYETIKYVKHVTAGEFDPMRIIQTCMWFMKIRRFFEDHGPCNPSTVSVCLSLTSPFNQYVLFSIRWQEVSDIAKDAVASRYNSADEATKARLFAEGKHELNMKEHGALPVVAMMEVLFGQEWKGRLRTAVQVVPSSSFPSQTHYESTMHICRLMAS